MSIDPHTEWLVRIIGQSDDLADLVRAFTSDALRLVVREANFYVASSDFSAALSAAEVRDLAEKKIAIMNGGMRLWVRHFRPVRFGGEIRQQIGDGANVFVFPEPATLTLRAGILTVMVSGDGQPARPLLSQPEEWTASAPRYEPVEKALRLLGVCERTWSDLYRLYEVVEGDTGGLEKIVKTGWATRRKIKQFTHTANNPKAAGDAARHGHSKEAPPPNPMPINEAESLVFSIVEQWLRSKSAVV